MRKHDSKFLIYPVSILLTIIIGIYAFTQAIQAPLTEINAEKVLDAWNILRGEQSLLTWRFHPLELPAYLLFVKLFGLSTFSSIAVNTFYFLLLFCTGLFILKTHDLLNLPHLLLWIAITGLPDPVWMGAIQNAPFLIFSLILLPHFLSAFLEHHRKSSAIAALFCLILAVFSLPKPILTEARPQAVHETIRALQTVFRADFSMQPLLKLTTGRYFLMTIIILLMLWGIFWTFRQFHREKNKYQIQLLYAIFIILTILWCCLPFSGDRLRKMTLCAWLPFGAAMLLIFTSEDMALRDLSFARQRLSSSALISIFAVLTILFGIGPIVRSRPVSPADRVIFYLSEQGLHQGYCPPSDHALLTVAGKGQITFTTDPDDPDNRFSILAGTDTDPFPDAEVISPYQIRIHQ